jgi:hypothetical protein
VIKLVTVFISVSTGFPENVFCGKIVDNRPEIIARSRGQKINLPILLITSQDQIISSRHIPSNPDGGYRRGNQEHRQSAAAGSIPQP